VNFYLANEANGDESLRPRGWAGMNWSPAIEVEHRGTREAAGLFDESSFSKIEVSGPGAAELMEWLCDNQVTKGTGFITYTQMLNARGGIEADVTVTQVDDETFVVITGTAFGAHDLSWIRSHAPADGSVKVRDVTGASVVFGLWGPKARAILQPLTPQSLETSEFPFLQMRETTVGAVPGRLLRVTFVGELGWEIHAPVEFGLGLWRSLWEAGRSHGLVAAGYRAIDSLRAEKGYRYWASDVTPDQTPDEAGLSFCVRPHKKFLGREALLEARAKADDNSLRMVCLALADPRQVVLGNEPVRVGGTLVGRVTTGAQGYSVGSAIAFAYVPAGRSAPGTTAEVLVFGQWVTAVISPAPLWDPKNERILA
jgi:glycine cleavage system aminomethyltransferase T